MTWRSFSLILLGILYGSLLLGVEPADRTQVRAKLYYGLAEELFDRRFTRRGKRNDQILRIAPDYVPALKLKSRIKLDQETCPRHSSWSIEHWNWPRTAQALL